MEQKRRPPRQRMSAQEVALEELRERILTGELKPGDQVVQELIAAQFGVSRVPVREALKILEGEGLVTYSPNHGYFITQLTLEEILEIYRIRDLLEDEATTRAVPVLTEADFARLEDANERLQAAFESQDVVEILLTNREFHDTIFAAGGTARLLKLIRIVWDSVEPYRSQYFRSADLYSQQIAEHRGIIAAARKGDIDTVLELSRAHRRHAVEAIESTITRSEAAAEALENAG